MGRRAVVIVLDGLGAGKAPDAADFGDEGANTLANTARSTGGLRAPNLQALGLGNIEEIEGIAPSASPAASHGLMVELSAAKATLAGHWEMMGLVLEDPLPTYPEGFPDRVLRRFEKVTGRGVLGNRPASGTGIIEELGPEQERTGAWILYTSADSVFQIAANTGVIPLDELYEASEKAHQMLIGEGEIMVERVIARPFHGEPGAYVRENENRHDYGITPPSETYLDRIKDAGHETVAVGKIKDIFDVRAALESLAASELAARSDRADAVAQLREAVAEMMASWAASNLEDRAASNLEDRIEADLKFHRTMCHLSGNETLLHSWSSLEGSIRMSIMFAGVDRGLKNMDTKRHSAIVDAIESGDADKAAAAVREHMAGAASVLVTDRS